MRPGCASAIGPRCGNWKAGLFSAGSLKSNPDYYHRDPFIALALKFHLRGLPGLDIRQTAGFVSDPNDGLVGDPESPVLLLPSVAEARPPGINRGDLSSRNRGGARGQYEHAADQNRQRCLVHWSLRLYGQNRPDVG